MTVEHGNAKVNLNSQSNLSDEEIRKRNEEDFVKNDLPKLMEQFKDMKFPPDWKEMSTVEKEMILKEMVLHDNSTSKPDSKVVESGLHITLDQKVSELEKRINDIDHKYLSSEDLND